ncbi:hypothetical protein ACHQM5_002259 [Ranunculus cassubicifolius]
MCHPGLPLMSFGGSGKSIQRRRWLVFQVVEVINNNLQGDGTVSGSAAEGHQSPKMCLCSPTRHPGSFRCRQHQAEYQWGSRIRVAAPPTSTAVTSQ